ncbi:hypothetical protein ADEAN_000346700 [Angomonas deanei]|uniref:Uncharacterized protein n=1 Tax=Angomonas deanei TaxID=59799 RepID=A0A7G2C905_9TRYP|nr:hypothetical protein ADEAN_000346700 [Angomonas deanei]
MVRLSVQNNNTDITLPLCQRAAAVLGDFTGKILSNVWVSLRLLRCLPLPFAELTCQQVLEPWEVHHTSQKSVVKLTTPEFLMITSSVMELYAREEARRSVSGLYGRKKKETDDPASKKNDFVAWYGSPLLQHKYKEAVFQLLPKPSKDVKEANLNGIVLYWGIQTLKRFCLAKDSSVSLSRRECYSAAVVGRRVCQSAQHLPR